ncbi:fimbria/pilus outer membrane usher protein [Pseudomonas hunanensis]|uniref:Uncharacterized protein n=1 Tax=Pseudomonas hunanensis TaxID=1247546 RepID=A0ACC9MX19_9PSED|nr:fimbria/pilus outer membrane usher protein [Pseudomonas hunanensis]PKF23484.1 hypothetical protein CW309_27055 [Pseudomonas hunanensis]
MLRAKRRRQLPSRLRFARLLALGGSCLLPAAQANEPELTFHSGFLRQSPGQAHGSAELALQALAAHQPMAAGRYTVQVRVNLAHAGDYALDFQEHGSDQGLVPCLGPELMAELGLRLDRLATPMAPNQQCLDLAAQLPGAQVEFDNSQLQLDIAIPQAALRRDAAGNVAPERWSQGINAGFVNYQASAMHSSQKGGPTRSQQDLYLNSGLNIGGWRLRSNQSLREDEHGQRRWTRSNTYAQTDLPGTWGTLTLGETSSNGEVFRSLPFKGVQLASDLGMLPDVLQSYAPVIRGVAQTRAKLEVLHNGYPIYSTYVAAGPYEIDDLGIGGGSGELEIVLTEADGQVRRFLQPYSSLGSLLREGVWRYSAAFGRYNALNGQDKPQLWQATLARGLGWKTPEVTGREIRCVNDGTGTLTFQASPTGALYPGPLPQVGPWDVNGKVMETGIKGVGLYIRLGFPFNGAGSNTFTPTDDVAIPYTGENNRDSGVTPLQIKELYSTMALIKTGPIPTGRQFFSGQMVRSQISFLGDALNIHVSGVVQQAHCTLLANPVSADPVQLGTYTLADFTGPGSYTDAKDFYVTLSDCRDDPAGGIASAYIRLEGAKGSVPLEPAQGVFSLDNKPMSVVVALGAMPANLKLPEVPLAADDLIDRLDAKQGVQVHVLEYDNWKSTDEISVSWGATPLEMRPIGEGQNFPVVFSIDPTVLRGEYDEDVLGTQVVNVSYEVLRGGKSRGSKAIDVNVNFETFGPVDPGTDPDPDWPDPINSRLPLCSVYGAKSNQANELLPVDDRLNATLKVDLYEGLEEHDLMEFYWGNTHITQADYQVKATDSAGDNITAEILWSYIQRTGNTTVPVHYEITRAGVPNKPASKNQSVTVSAVVVHPDAPGFEGVSDTGWLACEALVDPADPSLPAAVRVKVGDLSQYGLKENHLVTMHWKLLHAQSGDVEVLSWEQEIKLGTEYPPSGFIWRVEPYEDYILPLYEFDDDDHTGRAFSWYEFEDPSLREQGLDALIVSEVIEQKIAMHGVWGPCPVAFNRPQNNS